MSNNDGSARQHVGELLSGYIDNELTQQQRQRVDVHCDQCEHCKNELNELTALKNRISKSQLSTLDKKAWRESMDDLTVSSSRGIGWLLVIAGALGLVGLMIYELIFDSSVSGVLRISIAIVYLGFAALLLSVIRQRWVEQKTDKYKDVEI